MSLIKNNNGITLRLEKDSSLSFNEMDQNFSSFFYSASSVLDGDLNKLRLHYTGSNELDSGYEADRYMEVLLPRTTDSAPGETVSVPGDPAQIIFHGTGDSINQFATNTEFVFRDSKLGVGLNNPSAPLHLKSTTSSTIGEIRLEPKSSGETENTKAFYSINIGNTPYLRLGKTSPGDDEADKNIHLFTSKPLEIGYSNFLGGSDSIVSRKIRVTNQGVAIGNGIGDNADTPLTVVGEFSIGNTININSLHRIGSSNIHRNKLPSGGNTGQGLLIQSPKGNDGGNVVIGVNAGTNNKQSFSIVRGCGGDFSSNDTANCTIATFKVDGDVGIGQVNPKAKLHVEGNISGSGNFKVQGSATIETITELASLNTDWEGSNKEYARTLVKSSTGLVQYMDAAPVPKGGIIMWSGIQENIPKGWKLCNEETEVNGVKVPNLVSRFVIGGVGNDTFNGTKRVYTNIEGSDKKCYIGGSSCHNHTGKTGCHKLTLDQIPSHNHINDNFCSGAAKHLGMAYCFDKQFCKVGDTDCETGDHGVGGSTPELVTHFDTKDLLNCTTIKSEGGGLSHCHTVGSDNHIPPYYALAFIIYVGQ